MIKCQHCDKVIRDGDPHKVVSVGVETRAGCNATVNECHISQICCMTCELESKADLPEYGIEKPAAMADWPPYRAWSELSFTFINIIRERNLVTKLHKIKLLDWWDCLTGVEQHIVAKAYHNSRKG